MVPPRHRGEVSSEHSTHLSHNGFLGKRLPDPATICGAAFDFAVDPEVGDEITVGMVVSDGEEGGCA